MNLIPFEDLSHIKDINAFLLENGLEKCPVSYVEKINQPEADVWDICIDNEDITLPHSFFANDIVTHNSYSPEYMLAIAKQQGFKGDIVDLFGLQDDETGDWIKKPIIRRFQADVGEKFFDYVYKLEKVLPDKVYKNGQWWYVYEPTKANLKYAKSADETFRKRTGKYWIKASDSHPQALIVCDSYPAMLPEKMDDDEAKAGLAIQARMFSEQIKRVKGRMKPKGITLLGINQLRQIPMAMFGPKEQEPCGDALKFFSDCRLKMVGRAVPEGTVRCKDNQQCTEEPSIEFPGGRDIYRYVHVRAHKNKLSMPNLEGWLRIWVSDGNGEARGYDPVYDTLQFMKSTNIVSGTAKKLVIDFDKIGIKNGGKSKPLTGADLKALVIGDKKQIAKTLEVAGYKGRPFKLREKLFDLFKGGKAQKLYVEALKSKPTDESDSNSGSDED